MNTIPLRSEKYSAPTRIITVEDFIKEALEKDIDYIGKIYRINPHKALSFIIAAALDMRREVSGESGNTSRTNDGKTATSTLPENIPNDGDEKDGEEIPCVPEKAEKLLPRRPKRDTKSMDKASTIHVSTFLETYKLRGKVLGNITMAELRSMEAETEIELRLIKMLRGHAANAEGDQCVKDIMKEADAAAYIEKAIKGESDA